MIDTPDLISSLARDLQPVARLRSPIRRALSWLTLGALVLGLLSISQGLRQDLGEQLRDPDFVARLAGIVLTAVTAAAASFMLSLPDRSRAWLLAPIPGIVVWLSTLAHQCMTHWIVFSPGSISLGEAAQCFATIVLTSLPLSLVMLMMLRYAAPLRPTAAIAMGSLSVAGLSALGLTLFHEMDASLMILAWNLGVAALLVGCGCVFGDRLLCWLDPNARRLTR